MILLLPSIIISGKVYWYQILSFGKYIFLKFDAMWRNAYNSSCFKRGLECKCNHAYNIFNISCCYIEKWYKISDSLSDIRYQQLNI